MIALDGDIVYLLSRSFESNSLEEPTTDKRICSPMPPTCKKSLDNDPPVCTPPGSRCRDVPPLSLSSGPHSAPLAIEDNCYMIPGPCQKHLNDPPVCNPLSGDVILPASDVHVLERRPASSLLMAPLQMKSTPHIAPQRRAASTRAVNRLFRLDISIGRSLFHQRLPFINAVKKRNYVCRCIRFTVTSSTVCAVAVRC